MGVKRHYLNVHQIVFPKQFNNHLLLMKPHVARTFVKRAIYCIQQMKNFPQTGAIAEYRFQDF